MNFNILFTVLISLMIVNCFPQNSDDDDYNDEIYDPTSRDFTDRCNNMAQYAGPKACETFNLCCSEDFVLNKLNGDRCQISDPKNHCSLGADGTGIGYSHCKAFNCTAEITTTTTTTRTTPISGESSVCLSGLSLALASLLLRL